MSSVTHVHALYRQHHGWLRDWLRHRLGCSHQAADLAHDTFLRVLTAPDAEARVQSIATPRGYLATIARRVMVDHFRRSQLERAYLEALARLPEPQYPSPEAQAMVVEALMQVDAMLHGLGAKARQAFLLSELEGLSYGQIAERLGVSLSSVKKYLARAVERCLLMAAEGGLE